MKDIVHGRVARLGSRLGQYGLVVWADFQSLLGFLSGFDGGVSSTRVTAHATSLLVKWPTLKGDQKVKDIYLIMSAVIS